MLVERLLWYYTWITFLPLRHSGLRTSHREVLQTLDASTDPEHLFSLAVLRKCIVILGLWYVLGQSFVKLYHTGIITVGGWRTTVFGRAESWNSWGKVTKIGLWLIPVRHWPNVIVPRLNAQIPVSRNKRRRLFPLHNCSAYNLN